MAVKFLKHIALEIPSEDLEQAVTFYKACGLDVTRDDRMTSFACAGRQYDSIYLIPGSGRKRLHHIAMGATEAGAADVARRLKAAGIRPDVAPEGFSDDGLWFRNPHGLLFNVEVCSDEQAVHEEPAFLINSPGHFNRVNKAALPPKSSIETPRPRKLGHVAVFSPDIDESIDFVTDVLGMRLSDRSQNVIAFTHCQGGSDHHVLAFALSEGVGLHHISFMLGSPDEVGIAGYRLVERGYNKGWDFGRHAIGSNFFHYARDPWGSYLEFYADIDYIADSDSWVPSDWPLEDSLHTWGPNPPEDFVRNYELG